MKHGLLIKPRPTDYILGANSPLVFKAVGNGDWTPYWNFNEFQRDQSFDNDGCACYDANKTLDTWIDFLLPTFPAAVVSALQPFMDVGLDGKPHFHSSPRFTENLTGNGINGNSEGECFDVIRKYGAVPSQSFPFTETMTQAEYFTAPSPALLAQGLSFLTLMGGKQFLQYHFVSNGAPKNIAQMQIAILQSPLSLGIAVTDGWNQVIPTDPPASEAPQHAVICLKIASGGLLINDNYIPYVKTLDAGYPVNYVTQAVVSPIFPPPLPTPPIPTNIQPTQQNVSILQQIVALYQKILSLLSPKVGSSTNQNMESFIFSHLKSGTFWSSVVTVLGIIFTALSQQYPTVSWIGLVVSVLSAISAVYFNKKAVLAAAQSSATLGRVVSGQ